LIGEHVAQTAWSSATRALAVATERGLSLIEGDRVRSLYAFHGLLSNHLYAVAWDGSDLHVGTLAGLNLVRDLRVVAGFSAQGSPLRASWVTALSPAPEGIYVGLYGGGLARLPREARGTGGAGAGGGKEAAGGGGAGALGGAGPATGSWPPESLGRGAAAGLHINPGALLLDGDYLFAGTLEDGLCAFARQSGELLQLSRYLPSANVTAIAASAVELAVGTDRGLVLIPRRLLEPALLPLRPASSSGPSESSHERE
jgi:hypothetical protein